MATALLGVALALMASFRGDAASAKGPPTRFVTRPAPAPPRPFTVVVAMADDLGFEDLLTVSAMGGTPNLDTIAANGFRFDQAVGCVGSPICSPARMLGMATEVRDYAFAGVEGDPRFPGDVCARSARYKLRVLDVDHDGIDDSEEFYDMEKDPSETVDRVNDPALASVVQAHRDWLAEVRP